MESQNNNYCGAGKGDKPRNCFSKQYRDNYDAINWNKKEKKDEENINNSNTLNDKQL